MALLLLSTPERARVWQGLFSEAGEEIVIGEGAVIDPAAITHIACWQPPLDLTRYPNLKVVISVGAGVDQMPPMPKGVLLSRTVATGIDEMVRDWVVMATLMLHRSMPRYLDQANRAEWAAHPVRLARATRVGIMGMGRIGRLAAHSLSDLGFQVAGWSRSGRLIQGIEVFDAEGLDAFLTRTDVLICLLPLTEETRGLMDGAFLSKLPQGACLVHAGRGAQLDLGALKTALDVGGMTSAMLDVTDPEPLPKSHWAWSDPRVIVTPHIAAVTDHVQGARHALDVLSAGHAGREIPGFINPDQGY